MGLTGQRVVVLGGTSGIGLAVARAVVAEGATTVLGSSNRDRVERAAAAIAGAEGRVVDLRGEDSVRAFFDGVGAFDHLVYTAGEALLAEPVATLSLPEAQGFFGVRFWGAVMAAKHGAARMRAGGSIVLSSGLASRRSRAGWSMVSAVCGATEALTRALAVELAPLRVNLVCPGLVRTELWDGMDPAAREAMYERAARQLPLGRPGEPEEVAEAYLYLMKCRFSTGQVVIADGGAAVG